MVLFTSSGMNPINSERIKLQTITLTAMFLAVIVVLEMLMSSIPNVQLTVLLMMVYASTFPKRLFIPFVVAYVILDNFTGIFLVGSFDPIIMIPMTVAWLILLYATKAISNTKWIFIVLFATFFGFLYGWIYIPAHVIRFGITTLWPYFVADLPFEITMAISNLISVSILYKPLTTLLKDLQSGKYWKEI
jgi:energy-coupling factor transport system substrate-specific component